MSEVKEYTRDRLTVIWDAAKCTHSGRCVRGLPAVFNLQQRPWIQLDKATIEETMAQVDRCPSGALSYRLGADISEESSI